ncbi:MAG: diguanylate cyclase domain-containing protein [Acidimicrobiales bacterium]
MSGSRDETDRGDVRALTEALQENTRRLLELEALARVGSWEWDVAADVVAWSDEMYRIFGVKQDQFDATFAAYLSCLHPEDRALARETVERSLRTGDPYVADYRIVWPDGEERWLHCRGRAIVGAAGRVSRLLGTSQDITERKELEERLAHQALHDPLTGLPNRSLLQDRLSHAMQRTLRTQRHTAVFFVDLDRFKRINDGAGHATGDHVLHTIAGRLREAMREYDTVARYGGDEFVVIAEDLSWPVEAVDVADRIVRTIELPIGHGSGELVLTASVGATVVAGRAGPAEVLRDADIAMYQSKHRGGATVTWTENPAPGRSTT